MTIQNFAALREHLADRPTPILAIAGAEDKEIIQLAKELADEGQARSILVGDGAEIEALCKEAAFRPEDILSTSTPEAAAALACGLVASGRAQVLMKGMLNTSVFLRAVVHPERGLRNGRLLSHLAALEIPGQDHLHFYTDGGMCPTPDLQQKLGILQNALGALHRMGYECPKVAALAANEKVDPKIPASADAAALQQMNREGKLEGCLLEGPMAFDVAWSKEAAAHKHIESQISGEVDLFLCPDIQAGNLTSKALIYGAGAKMAGVILGATHPIVLVSRADDAEAKRNSLNLAYACL